ncbi:HNH endonuclease signature motif containing protein [Jatrophihabitans sp.]|jgi:hypothetical protein|uniref:HNH endonuclease signature motif containing protein n=1 Tax=Jatrophihabitans sp. TaxID=1932789 RepID=UPI002EE707AB
MTIAVGTGAAVLAASQLPAAVGQLAGCSLSTLADEELLEVVRVTERARRQLEALDATLIAELEARNLPGRLVLRGPAQLLSGLLNLSPVESSARVRQARELGSRSTLTGDRLPPLLPATAAARADGAITAKHAEVIIQTMTRLRAAQLPVPDQVEAEAFLVEQAQSFNPSILTGIARQLIDTLDPDGRLADEQSQQRHRFLTCVPTGDGMHRLTADLDPETAALAMTVLHALAAPKPSTAGDRDERSAGQRLHDAFRSVLKLALRAGELPTSAGIPTTVLITMTADQFETGTGLAHTSYGQKLSVDRALRMADQAAIGWIVHSSTGGILNYGTTRRTATDKQTLALIVRDQGCAFPGCADPPEWTEKHHIKAWRHGGATDLDNLCLLCDFHHDRIDTGGWTITMLDGVPWFVPPVWVDAEQRPRRNVRA